MKSNTQKHLSSVWNIVRKHVVGSRWQQAISVAFPAIIAIGVARSTFISLGDLQLSVVLGCTAFIVVTPLVASIDGHHVSEKHKR